MAKPMAKPVAKPMAKTHGKSVGQTDICQTDGHLSDGRTSVRQTHSNALEKNCTLEKLFYLCSDRPPNWREDSKNGLRFEIGPWEAVELNVDGRTNEQTDKLPLL